MANIDYRKGTGGILLMIVSGLICFTLITTFMLLRISIARSTAEDALHATATICLPYFETYFNSKDCYGPIGINSDKVIGEMETGYVINPYQEYCKLLEATMESGVGLPSGIQIDWNHNAKRLTLSSNEINLNKDGFGQFIKIVPMPQAVNGEDRQYTTS